MVPRANSPLRLLPLTYIIVRVHARGHTHSQKEINLKNKKKPRWKGNWGRTLQLRLVCPYRKIYQPSWTYTYNTTQAHAHKHSNKYEGIDSDREQQLPVAVRAGRQKHWEGTQGDRQLGFGGKAE